MHQTLYYHFQTRFHANYPQQTLLRYDSTNNCFFRGLITSSGTSFVSVFYNTKDDRLIFSAGKAHGVYKRNEYKTYPYYASENPRNILSQESIKLQVQTIESLTSELVVVDPSHAEHIARKCPSICSRVITVGLERRLPSGEMAS
jgi:hypothetical protein